MTIISLIPNKTDALAEFQINVLQWAKDRGIIPNATPESQTLKAVSEVGELADAVLKRDRLATVDAIGDVLVCLINVAALTGISLEECTSAAWEQIKDRKGYLLPNGVFVKEEQK